MRPPFDPQKMVCWYHPVQLARTAFRVMFADYITSVVDIREMQARLQRVRLPQGANVFPREPTKKTAFDLEWGHQDQPLWIDYVSDLGDGWDATYAVAELIARDELKIRGVERPLPRADLLVLGGDCVYPTPTLEEYGNRLVGPYDAARSDLHGDAIRKDDAKRREEGGLGPSLPPDPNLLTIPGNHDWYDGLMSFSRVFCRGARIGAWQTRQTRSYFAVKLPHNWSLWGVDIQLDSRIDTPQLYFFEDVARQLVQENRRASIKEKPRLIICTACPAWFRERPAYDRASRNYWYLVARTLELGCDPWVTLSGDLHHYSRYESSAGRQLVTAGGGGSYFSATHDLPRSVSSPRPDDERVESKTAYHEWEDGDGAAFAEAGFSFPGRIDSRRLTLRTLWFPFLSANWTFCVLLGLADAWIVWTLRWSAGPDVPWSQVQSFFSKLASFPLTADGFRSFVGFVVETLRATPAPWFPFVVVVSCFAAFCAMAEPGLPRWTRWLWGGVHGVVQFMLGIVTAWLLAHALGAVSENVVDARWGMAIWLVVLLVFGGLLGGFLMGAYLVVSDRFLGWHLNEVFAAQASPDFRCFIRMRLDPDGSLTLHPIGLRRVPRRWRRRVEAREFQSQYEARDECPGPELIEGPVTVARPKRPAPGPAPAPAKTAPAPHPAPTPVG